MIPLTSWRQQDARNLSERSFLQPDRVFDVGLRSFVIYFTSGSINRFPPVCEREFSKLAQPTSKSGKTDL
jgi:hypothetical protein